MFIKQKVELELEIRKKKENVVYISEPIFLGQTSTNFFHGKI